MCGGLRCGEGEELVSVERWSCSRGALCAVEYTIGKSNDCSLLILPFLATKSAVLSTMSGHCQGEDNAQCKQNEMKSSKKNCHPRTTHYTVLTVGIF